LEPEELVIRQVCAEASSGVAIRWIDPIGDGDQNEAGISCNSIKEWMWLADRYIPVFHNVA
jgi:hypothetical protein